MRLGTLPPTTRGFDCDARVSRAQAIDFYAANYRFAVRYVRRGKPNGRDITPTEVRDILSAGLGLMVVQHVDNPGWRPDGPLGTRYGTIAAEESSAAGILPGSTVWCDLEEVSRDSLAYDVIQYCNAWHDAVRAAGFEPGLYVGYGCGLTATQLYRSLKFARYWAAYNLDLDKYPIVRGVCMRQGVARAKDRVSGVPFDIDTNIILADALGGLPTLCLPACP